MQVAFLVGSGISIDAGMPSVGDISAQVFSGDDVVRHSDATYYLAADPDSRAYDFHRTDVAATVALVDRLRDLAAAYFNDYGRDHTVDYEDVANVIAQVADALSGEYENPALYPLLREMRTELAVDDDGLLERFTECRNYVADVVWRMLARPPAGLGHLRAIVDACHELRTVNLFDLNHDTVLESALSEAGVDCSDGFIRTHGDVFFWADVLGAPCRRFKLHGSINWFHRTLPEEPWRGWIVARSTTADPYRERGPTGELLDFPASGRPVILVGTFDKPLAYGSTVFADQHYHFHDTLRRLDRLVVIGYGFRDKGINSRLIDWLLRVRDRRLVVVHGDEESLLTSARYAIASKWQRWQDEGRLLVLDGWVADASWADIRDLL